MGYTLVDNNKYIQLFPKWFPTIEVTIWLILINLYYNNFEQYSTIPGTSVDKILRIFTVFVLRCPYHMKTHKKLTSLHT